MFDKALFPLLYLPAFVSFRFTDILRGLVAQPIMWLYDYHLGFTKPTVEQVRNPHDYVKDFMSEVPMYEHGYKIPDIVKASISADSSLSDNLMMAYEALYKEKIVPKEELLSLSAWLNDLEKL